jgi:hypothetical protein
MEHEVSYNDRLKQKQMAKQDSILRMTGNIDNINFFKKSDGTYHARKKGGIDKNRLLNDPKYKRTREHMAEFGLAIKGAKLIRRSLLKAIIGSVDNKVSNRLASKLVAITREDPNNLRGERIFTHSGLTSLKGFDFNAVTLLDTVLLTQVGAEINRTTGECTVTIPPYVPEEQLKLSPDATHYRFRIAAAAIDFATATFEMQTAVSPYMVMDTLTETTALTLGVTLTPASVHPLMLALTIEFVQETEEGTMYPLKNGSMNPCRIEAVSVEE